MEKPVNPLKTGLPLAIFSILALFCFLAMLAVTLIWMPVPTRIVYHESSPVRTEAYSVVEALRRVPPNSKQR